MSAYVGNRTPGVSIGNKGLIPTKTKIVDMNNLDHMEDAGKLRTAVRLMNSDVNAFCRQLNDASIRLEKAKEQISEKNGAAVTKKCHRSKCCSSYQFERRVNITKSVIDLMDNVYELKQYVRKLNDERNTVHRTLIRCVEEEVHFQRELDASNKESATTDTVVGRNDDVLALEGAQMDSQGRAVGFEEPSKEQSTGDLSKTMSRLRETKGSQGQKKARTEEHSVTVTDSPENELRAAYLELAATKEKLAALEDMVRRKDEEMREHIEKCGEYEDVSKSANIALREKEGALMMKESMVQALESRLNSIRTGAKDREVALEEEVRRKKEELSTSNSTIAELQSALQQAKEQLKTSLAHTRNEVSNVKESMEMKVDEQAKKFEEQLQAQRSSADVAKAAVEAEWKIKLHESNEELQMTRDRLAKEVSKCNGLEKELTAMKDKIVEVEEQREDALDREWEIRDDFRNYVRMSPHERKEELEEILVNTELELNRVKHETSTHREKCLEERLAKLELELKMTGGKAAGNEKKGERKKRKSRPSLPSTKLPSSFDVMLEMIQNVDSLDASDLENVRGSAAVHPQPRSEFDISCLASTESVETPQLEAAAWPFDPSRAWNLIANKALGLIKWERHSVDDGATVEFDVRGVTAFSAALGLFHIFLPDSATQDSHAVWKLTAKQVQGLFGHSRRYIYDVAYDSSNQLFKVLTCSGEESTAWASFESLEAKFVFESASTSALHLKFHSYLSGWGAAENSRIIGKPPKLLRRGEKDGEYDIIRS